MKQLPTATTNPKRQTKLLTVYYTVEDKLLPDIWTRLSSGYVEHAGQWPLSASTGVALYLPQFTKYAAGLTISMFSTSLNVRTKLPCRAVQGLIWSQ